MELAQASAPCRLTSASERDVSEAMACEGRCGCLVECVVGLLFVGLSWVCSARTCVLSWVEISLVSTSRHHRCRPGFVSNLCNYRPCDYSLHLHEKQESRLHGPRKVCSPGMRALVAK